MRLVYKVLTLAEWEEADVKGVFAGSPSDLRDGFIHLSTAEQTEETVLRHFSDSTSLILAAVDPNALGAGLRWEPSRGGSIFPHLYGPLHARDIIRATPFDARRPGDLRELLAG